MNNFMELIQFVLEEGAKQPLAKRVRLLRGLAEVCGDKKEAEELNALANSLSLLDKRCAEFNFSFVQKHTN